MPVSANNSQPVIWLHACSVGEINAVAPLIRALLQRGQQLHLTLVTATGMAQAQRLFALQNVDTNKISYSFLPWDLPFAFQRFVQRLRPCLLLLTETEFWPGMLAACQKQQITIIAINSRISDRSFPRYLRTRWLWQSWLKPIQLFLTQSSLDAQRLQSIGVAANRIQITGNLKYAIQAPAANDVVTNHKRTIIIAASTHAGEEEVMLHALAVWKKICPDVLLILVPRHPQRFDAVCCLVKEYAYILDCWSWHAKGISIANIATITTDNADVLLINAMGVLPSLYPIADVVFIGGSLVDIGGHNPLEAAVCGRSVCTGKYVQNFRDIMQVMQQEQAAYIGNNAQDITQYITKLLQNKSYRQQLHIYAANFMQRERDVLQNYLLAIEKWMDI